MNRIPFILSFVFIGMLWQGFLYAEEPIFFLDPDQHKITSTDGKTSPMHPQVTGISQDSFGNIIVLSRGGLFKKLIRPDGTEDSTQIIEEPSETRSPIIQYQLDQTGRLALLRTDGTIEINFAPTQDQGSMGFDKRMNAQIAFSQKGLWVLQKEAALYKWSPEEHVWKFVVQDEDIRAIVATSESLYVLKILDNGRFAICEFKEDSEKPDKIEIIRTNLSFGKNLDFLSLPTRHIEPLTFGYHDGFLLLLTRDTQADTYQLISIPEELVRKTLMEGTVINKRDVKMMTIDFSSYSKNPNLKLMTTSGMNCKIMKWFADAEPSTPPTPSLANALSHIQEGIRDQDPHGFKTQSFLDSVAGRMLSELTVWEEHEGASFPKPPGTQEALRLEREAFDKDTLRALDTLLKDPQMRRMTLERLVDLIIEAQKRNPRLK